MSITDTLEIKTVAEIFTETLRVERVEVWAIFYSKNLQNRIVIQRICGKTINCFGGHAYRLTTFEKSFSFINIKSYYSLHLRQK